MAGSDFGSKRDQSQRSLGCDDARFLQPDPSSLRVHRVACAIDCGVAVNPPGIEAQMQAVLSMV